MSTHIKDGGPAFPDKRRVLAVDGTPHFGGALEHVPGMSLRDYFAGKALEGIEASQGNSVHFVITAERVAIRAYELADAMLKARES